MSSLEVKVLDSCNCKPLLYKKYIDDIFLLWCHGREEFDSFVQLLNAQHPSIRFTVEHSDTPMHSISFLDLTVSVSNYTLDWELFIKPYHSGVHLSYMSSIPLSTKRVVAANQFKRALEASTLNGQDRGTNNIHQLLLNNDYPPDEIEWQRRVTEGRRRRGPCLNLSPSYRLFMIVWLVMYLVLSVASSRMCVLYLRPVRR